MRPIAISRLETATHVLEADRAEASDTQTRFRLRTLTGGQRLDVFRLIVPAEKAGGEKGNTFAAGLDACRKALEFALVGWENVAAEDGKPAPWPGNATRALDMLPPFVVLELGAEVIRRSELGGPAGNA